MSASPQGPPNQRLNTLELRGIRPLGSATGPERTASWSRPDDRLETTVAATACTHSVLDLGAPRLVRHRSALRFPLGPGPPPPAVDSQNH